MLEELLADLNRWIGDAPALDPACALVQIDAEAPALEASRSALRDPERLVLAIHADVAATAEALAGEAEAHAAVEWRGAVESARDFRPAGWSEMR